MDQQIIYFLKIKTINIFNSLDFSKNIDENNHWPSKSYQILPQVILISKNYHWFLPWHRVQHAEQQHHKHGVWSLLAQTLCLHNKRGIFASCGNKDKKNYPTNHWVTKKNKRITCWIQKFEWRTSSVLKKRDDNEVTLPTSLRLYKLTNNGLLDSHFKKRGVG